MDLDLISKYFVLFMMYSFAGWVMETTWVSICNKKVVDRGFLIGPYCPIYGFGAILIIVFLKIFAFNPILLFIMTTIICGFLEYYTSWFMEKIFKARWWDYSDKKININGRVCLKNLIAFGVMGLLVTYFLNPYFEEWIKYLNREQLQSLAIILWTIFVADLVLSTVVVYSFRKVTEKVNKEGKMDNTEQITQMVREELAAKSLFHRRFINAYPSLEAIKLKMREIKTKIEDVTSDAKDKVAKKVTVAKDKVNEKMNDAKDIVVEKVNDAKDAVSIKKEQMKNTIENRTKKAKLKIHLGKRYLKSTYKKKFNK